jgi:hypothetical protein
MGSCPSCAVSWRAGNDDGLRLRNTFEETEALLADVGLTDPLWNLREG